MSLQQTQIDKTIEELTKKFLKHPLNKQFLVHPSKEGANMVIVFRRTNVYKYIVALWDKNNEYLLECLDNPSLVTLVFLKNENPHDARRATLGDVRCKLDTKPSKIINTNNS